MVLSQPVRHLKGTLSAEFIFKNGSECRGVNAMSATKKLGDMLKEAGLIDDFQLQSSLSYQRTWGGKLGSILIELEFIKEVDLARLLSEQLRIPYVNPFDPEIPESVIKLIKPEVAKKYHVLPVRKEKGTLMLVMSDPLDIESMDGIRFITGLEIKPALALESEIRDAIRKYYDHEEFTRKESSGSPFHPRGSGTGGKMEIIKGSDLNMPNKSSDDENSPLLPKDKSLNLKIEDDRMRLDALITILIEKGVITREELVSMVYQKKMGL